MLTKNNRLALVLTVLDSAGVTHTASDDAYIKSVIESLLPEEFELELETLRKDCAGEQP